MITALEQTGQSINDPVDSWPSRTKNRRYVEMRVSAVQKRIILNVIAIIMTALLLLSMLGVLTRACRAG